MTIKIESLIGETTRPVDYGNIFMREIIPGRDRLVVGVSHDQHRCVLDLASVLVGQCQILYVLHTTRTGAQLGRYESPELSLEQLREFLQEFGKFLSEDSRHDMWLHSYDDDATIVLDRHNLIYTYGPLESFEQVLVNSGLRNAAVPRIPNPHVHNYHAEWDAYEKAILERWPWNVSPLREEDIQWHGDGHAG
jgi:hypothetical protein